MQYLGLGKQVLEEKIVQERLVGLVIGFLDEEMTEVTAHQLLIIANRRMQRYLAVIRIQVGRIAAMQTLVQELGIDVANLSRQLQVVHEALLVVLPLGAIQVQSLVHDMDLERVMGIVERLDETPHPLQVGAFL